ncbi:hypothetical protein [Streptomyces brevispora]|uniref:hypothetical protein n=1 Tax=Streptomyces brevispora TaxID=887462 RepID=UPI0035DA0CC6
MEEEVPALDSAEEQQCADSSSTVTTSSSRSTMLDCWTKQSSAAMGGAIWKGPCGRPASHSTRRSSGRLTTSATTVREARTKPVRPLPPPKPDSLSVSSMSKITRCTPAPSAVAAPVPLAPGRPRTRPATGASRSPD